MTEVQDLLGQGTQRGPDAVDIAGMNVAIPDWALVHAEFDQKIYRDAETDRKNTFLENWHYYDGLHRKFLKVKAALGSMDDNVIINFCGVLIDRTIARLFGDPTRGRLLSFDIESKSEVEAAVVQTHETGEEGASGNDDAREAEAQAIVQNVWTRSGSLYDVLSSMGMYGAITGHYCFKIVRENEGSRVIVIDSSLLGMLTRQDDKQKIKAYKIEYEIMRRDPKDANNTIKLVDFRQLIVSGEDYGAAPGWYVTDFINWRRNNPGESTWQQQSETEKWQMCPLVAGQNLPNARNVWGKSDMENVIGLNDEINFLMSNVNRIVRYHAHPRTIAIGVEPDSIQETAIDQFWAIPASPEEVSIQNLEMESDLSAVFAFFQTIREAFWTIGREADPATFKEKIGNVTNFGLRVLFLDALNKLGQKREKYGTSLTTLIERLLVLEGYDDLTVVLKWHDPLPSDPRESVETMLLEIDAGILSKETAARERGRNWDLEKTRIEEDKQMDDKLARKALGLLRGEETVRPNTDQR